MPVLLVLLALRLKNRRSYRRIITRLQNLFRVNGLFFPLPRAPGHEAEGMDGDEVQNCMNGTCLAGPYMFTTVVFIVIW
jgi:hypothetical protein